MNFWRFLVIFVVFCGNSYAKKVKVLKLSPLEVARGGFADLAEGLLPAVVNISTTRQKSQDFNFSFLEGAPKNRIFGELKEKMNGDLAPQKRETSSIGSGFLVSDEGFIATNYHVIEGADKISVGLHDGRKFAAKIVGFDEKTDLALLKIKGENFDFVVFGNSNEARIGDWVLVIGNPYGLGSSVSAGIVSANNRSVNRIDNFIQTDAAINKGNSGGPMFNMAGEVIGVSTSLFSPSGGSVGIGFANPSSVVRFVIDQLMENGEVIRGWIGVSVRDDKDKVVVIEVIEGSPAQKAGVMQGDVILRFDGREIAQMNDLPKIVVDSVVGEEYELVILRDGEEIELKVKVGKLGQEEFDGEA